MLLSSTLAREANGGLTLIELLVSLALSAFLLLGLIQIASAASFSTLLQRNHSRLQEHARYANIALSKAIRQSGFNPQPWNPDFPAVGLAETSLDGVSSAGDRLVVRFWSDLNCFENRNPETDTSGNPLFFIRESSFDINSSQSLTHHCRYGPTLSELSTQIRRQGFINEVESFQVLYGMDTDRNGNIDSWVKAGEWLDPANVLGVRIGLLLSSREAFLTPVKRSHQVLDSTVNKNADGKLRRVIEFTTALRGRTG